MQSYLLAPRLTQNLGRGRGGEWGRRLCASLCLLPFASSQGRLSDGAERSGAERKSARFHPLGWKKARSDGRKLPTHVSDFQIKRTRDRS